MNNQKTRRAGDSAQITRDYMDSILIEMRHIGNELPSTNLELYGRTFSSPIMMAAFSHLDTFGIHENGMVEIAKAASSTNIVNFAGMEALRSLKTLSKLELPL